MVKGVSFWADEYVLGSIIMMVAQACECTKSH